MEKKRLLILKSLYFIICIFWFHIGCTIDLQTKPGIFDFAITQEELLSFDTVDGSLGSQSFVITAYVTEELTGKVLNTTYTFTIEQERLKLEFLDATPSSFRPGLLFTSFVSQYK